MDDILVIQDIFDNLDGGLSIAVLVRTALIVLFGGKATDESVNLRLYNNEVNGSLIDRDDLSLIDANKNTLFVVHGFRATWQDFDEICRLHVLNDTSTQVINVDWGKLAGGINYIAAVKNSETVGKYIGKVMSNVGLRGNKIRILGFSLGAHSAGFAAKHFTELINDKVSQIIGLDPAGPMYSYKTDMELPDNMHLAKTDADVVITLKTNRGLYGSINDFGHINFYVNNAVAQPGCKFLDIVCSHYFAVNVYTKTILRPEYLATKFQHWSGDNTPIGLDPNETLWFLENNIFADDEGLYHFSTKFP